MRGLGVVLFSALVSQAALAESSSVSIELNKLETHESACRAYLVLENGTNDAFHALKLDLVMFDVEGIVAKRLAVEVAPLPAGKTSLKVFEIDDMACEGIGRVLLNSDLACADAAGSRDDCLDLISTSARGQVAFVK